MKKFNVGIKSIIEKDGKILLLKKAGGDFWEVPGGRIDDSETIEQTLKRELNEEVPGISNIQVKGIVHGGRLGHDIKEDLGLILLFFRVQADVPEDLKVSDEHSDYKWATPEEAIEMTQDIQQNAFKAYFGRE